jgi:heme/copper-type cytochrome/quinol oxidase subunit 2
MKKRIIIAVVIALLVVFMIYKKRIIHWLEPAADWMHRTPGGFLIPIAILIVLSIPPVRLSLP